MRSQTNCMTLSQIHPKAVNQAAHAAAVRFEIEARDRWIQELTRARKAGATFAELQAKLSRFAGEIAQEPTDR